MKVFIGSSSEHVGVAQQLALIIERLNHKPVLWKNGFVASDWTFERLTQICDEVDAAIFVLAPDDEIMYDNKTEFITRDNVLIEAGLFSGKLGKTKVALCRFPETRIPTDFLGITFINYYIEREFEVVRQISDWINAVAKFISDNNNTVFFQDYLPNFKEVVLSAKKEIMMSSFFMSIIQISKELEDAIFNGLNVRLLLSDFWGKNWMATVALLDGVRANGNREKLKLATTLLWLAEKKEKEQIPDNLQIRLIDCVLPTRMTIVDPDLENGNMYVHLNFYKNRCGANMTYNLKKQQPWFRIFVKEFEDMWEDARLLDFDEVKSMLEFEPFKGV